MLKSVAWLAAVKAAIVAHGACFKNFWSSLTDKKSLPFWGRDANALANLRVMLRGILWSASVRVTDAQRPSLLTASRNLSRASPE